MTASAAVDDWLPPFRSCADLLAEGDAEAPYLTELDHARDVRRAWTRGEWRRRVQGAAAALAARGVQPGDSVAVLAGNSADALTVAFACWSAGYCYLPLNAHESVERHGFIIGDADARMVLHSPDHAAAATALGDRTGVRVLPLADACADDRTDPGDAPVAADLGSPALRVYTSGTTGEPKGVVLTAANLLTDADALAQVLGWDAGTRVLIVLPVHHVNGLVLSSLVSWFTGASAVLCDRFRSQAFWEDVEAERATDCSMVPSLLEFLLADGAHPAPAHFREVLCGAGPLMCETVAAFEQGFGVPVRHLYGLSETTAVATMMPTLADDVRRSWYADPGFPSVGPALPHVEVAVHDPEGRPCPQGERGEIVIRGATVMTGYAGRAEATASALRDGWFHSGDEGFWLPGPDNRPYFFVTGRLKELIIRGGVNISPIEIDEVLCQHPAVRFGLALPFENRFYGEEVAAYVVPHAPVTEEELLAFCADRLDFAYQPKVIVFGEDVPFTATGKAKRLSLKSQLGDRLAEYRDVQFRRRGHSAPKDPR